MRQGAAHDDELLDHRYKAIPRPVRLRDLGAQGWHGLDDLLMPVLLVRERRLRDNVAAMATFCREQRVLLAPHAKTSMAPKLLEMQARAGAWAFTAASPSQLRLLREWGVERVLYANQIVEPVLVEWLREQAAWEVWCLVDSPASVAAIAGLGLDVLVELGHPGGRTGCRSEEQALDVVRIARTAGLRVRGVECFEGTVAAGDFASVDALLERCDSLLARTGLGLVSAGGSAYFDRVLERFGGRDDLQVVLRSGCYVTQDGGFYDEMSPLAGRASAGARRLENALEAWGAVLSRPEPELAIASFGKRDVPLDLGFPRPFARHRRGEGRAPLAGEIVALSDQHAHVRVAAGADLRPGDLLGAHVVHPCTAFDRWRLVPLVDDDYRVVDGLLTFF